MTAQLPAAPEVRDAVRARVRITPAARFRSALAAREREADARRRELVAPARPAR